MPLKLSSQQAKSLGLAQKKKRTAKAKSGPTMMQLAMIEGCKKHGLPEHGLRTPVPEYKFHPDRKWRFDWAWPPNLIALEIDGGVWLKGGGRHNRGAGFLKDQEKMNEAVILGWRVLHCSPSDVESGRIFELLKRAL